MNDTLFYILIIITLTLIYDGIHKYIKYKTLEKSLLNQINVTNYLKLEKDNLEDTLKLVWEEFYEWIEVEDENGKFYLDYVLKDKYRKDEVHNVQQRR